MIFELVDLIVVISGLPIIFGQLEYAPAWGLTAHRNYLEDQIKAKTRDLVFMGLNTYAVTFLIKDCYWSPNFGEEGWTKDEVGWPDCSYLMRQIRYVVNLRTQEVSFSVQNRGELRKHVEAFKPCNSCKLGYWVPVVGAGSSLARRLQ